MCRIHSVMVALSAVQICVVVMTRTDCFAPHIIIYILVWSSKDGLGVTVLWMHG